MPDNEHRIAAARTALESYRVAKNGAHAEVDEADARDLITDILHYMMSEGKDIQSELRMALNNFTDEADVSPYEVRRIDALRTFLVSTLSTVVMKGLYRVEAETKEEANQKVRENEGECIKEECVDYVDGTSVIDDETEEGVV